MSVSGLLMRLGLSLPEHLLSDEKFATLTGERIYLFLVSQGELIWHGAWMNSVNETAFNEAISQFLTVMETSAKAEQLLEPEASYAPSCLFLKLRIIIDQEKQLIDLDFGQKKFC